MKVAVAMKVLVRKSKKGIGTPRGLHEGLVVETMVWYGHEEIEETLEIDTFTTMCVVMRIDIWRAIAKSTIRLRSY